MDRIIRLPPKDLEGVLSGYTPGAPLVVFAHGSGSSRHSPRNRAVAAALNAAGFATLLFDLLTPEEEDDRRNVFAIELLANRLVEAVNWLDREAECRLSPMGLFGASTGGAAAMVAAASLGDRIGAVVSRGGRVDLAGEALAAARAPTLLVVGGEDHPVLELNERSLQRMQCVRRLEIVPGASHLFPEPGALERVIALSIDWFRSCLVEEGRRSGAAPR